MCLSSVSKVFGIRDKKTHRIKPVTDMVVPAWKAISLGSDGKVRTNYDLKTRVSGKWYKSGTSSKDAGKQGYAYEPGFHAFLSKANAITYGYNYVVPVLMRKVVAYGSQDNNEKKKAIVAREMMLFPDAVPERVN